MRISTKDPLDILIDPDIIYDPKTWNEVFETKWMSLDQVEEQYGQEVADKLRVAAEYGSTMGQDSVEYEETRYGDTYTGVEYDQGSTTNPEENRQLRAFVLSKDNITNSKNVDRVTGDMRQVPATGAKERKKFADDFGLDNN